jgi:U3 small nucleolar ribonucleoprotein protein IMP4
LVAGGELGVGRVIVTTSRRPSPRSRSFAKDLVSVLPGGVRLTRGHSSYVDLAREALKVGADRVVVIGEWRGNPGVMRVYEPTGDLGLRHIVAMVVLGVKLSRESGASKPVNPKFLVVEADGSAIAEEFSEAFVRAFHARLRAPGDVRDCVIARLEGLTVDSVRLTFYWRGAPAGPQVRLRKPRNIKSWITAST